MVRFLNMSFNTNYLLRRTLNILNFLFNLHIPIAKKYIGVFYQPHISVLKPGKGSTGWIIRMHDLFPITNPEWFRWWANKIFKRNLDFAVRNGAYFLFSSNYSKNVFLNLYPECIERVDISPCATSVLTQSLCKMCEGCREIEDHPEQSSTLLAVGTIEPRKNYEFLIHFWRLNRNRIPGVVHFLVIGAPGWKTKKTQRALSQLVNAKWVKNACDGSLNYFYGNSKYFVSASHDEGFNLPALEARLDYGMRIFLSDIPIHHEIHDNRAAYFKNAQDLFSSLSAVSNVITNREDVKNDNTSLDLNDFFKRVRSDF